ncbi:diguanylate cyclase [Capsulimonas corticalis]|uniref:Diguanylate cyclase n=1 Tax=Capsulimonas corticalis TaxID=2219043 RepID=A0A402D7A3_9BACT|nr:sensor domain-containing diguanylate cyclase [Capsulimonas corticalis]BDI33959.1 diguanylate cyclase [Capsulimonas corticalis]
MSASQSTCTPLRGQANRPSSKEGDYHAAFHHATAGMGMIDLDGCIIAANPAFSSLIGYTQKELLCHDFLLIMHPDDRIATENDFERILSGESHTFVIENRLIHKDESFLWVKMSISSIRNDAGSLLSFVVVMEDISEMMHTREILHLERERFHALAQGLGTGIIMTDLNDIVTYANPYMRQITGYSPEELIGQRAMDLLLAPKDRAAMAAHNNDRAGGNSAIYEIKCVHKDGSAVWLEVRAIPYRNACGEIVGTQATVNNITARRESEQRLQEYMVVLEFQRNELEKANTELEALATTDGLTGLKNHRAFQECLTEEVNRASRYGQALSLVLMDVDNFKQFNDAHGHPAGDVVLKTVAHFLRKSARDTDITARYGGEEFVIILPETEMEGACAFAERLRASIEDNRWPVRPVTASFGVAVLKHKNICGADIIARADKALYQAKAAGRNCVIIEA